MRKVFLYMLIAMAPLFVAGADGHPHVESWPKPGRGWPVEPPGGGSSQFTMVYFGCVSCGSANTYLGRETASAFAFLAGEHVVTTAGTLKNLRCDAFDNGVAWGAGDKNTYTVSVEPDGYNTGAGHGLTSVTCETAAGASTQDRFCDDTTNTHAVSAGALIVVHLADNGTSPNTSHSCSLEIH